MLSSAKATSALSDAWRALLPEEPETILLRALVGPVGDAKSAWQSFEQRIGNVGVFFEEDCNGLKALLPLLEHTAKERQFQLEGSFRTRMRVASLREELRNQHVIEIMQQALSALANDGKRALLLPGVAVAQSAYASPSTRHNHALRLLVPSAADAAAVLCREGFDRPTADTPFQIRTANHLLTVVHPNGLPVALYENLLPDEQATLDYEQCFANRGPIMVGSEEVYAVSGSHQLAFVLSRAAAGVGTRNLRWVFDSYALISQHLPNGLATLFSPLHPAAAATGTNGFLVHVLRYLSTELGVLPDYPEIQQYEADSTVDERQALYAALAASQRRRKALQQIRDPYERLRLVSHFAAARLGRRGLGRVRRRTQ